MLIVCGNPFLLFSLLLSGHLITYRVFFFAFKGAMKQYFLLCGTLTFCDYLALKEEAALTDWL